MLVVCTAMKEIHLWSTFTYNDNYILIDTKHCRNIWTPSLLSQLQLIATETSMEGQRKCFCNEGEMQLALS